MILPDDKIIWDFEVLSEKYCKYKCCISTQYTLKWNTVYNVITTLACTIFPPFQTDLLKAFIEQEHNSLTLTFHCLNNTLLFKKNQPTKKPKTNHPFLLIRRASQHDKYLLKFLATVRDSYICKATITCYSLSLPFSLSFIPCQHLHIPTMENGPEVTTRFLNKLSDIQVRCFLFYNQVK